MSLPGPSSAATAESVQPPAKKRAHEPDEESGMGTTIPIKYSTSVSLSTSISIPKNIPEYKAKLIRAAYSSTTWNS